MANVRADLVFRKMENKREFVFDERFCPVEDGFVGRGQLFAGIGKGLPLTIDTAYQAQELPQITGFYNNLKLSGPEFSVFFPDHIILAGRVVRC